MSARSLPPTPHNIALDLSFLVLFVVLEQLPFFKTYMAHRFFRKWRSAARASALEKVWGGAAAVCTRPSSHGAYSTRSPGACTRPFSHTRL